MSAPDKDLPVSVGKLAALLACLRASKEMFISVFILQEVAEGWGIDICVGLRKIIGLDSIQRQNVNSKGT